MDKNEELFALFDSMPEQELPKEWEEKLMLRIKNQKREIFNAGTGSITVVCLIAVVNLSFYALNFVGTNSKTHSQNMKLLANEFLVSTSSSKY